MNIYSYLIISVLCLVNIIVVIKLIVIKKSAREVEQAIIERDTDETNSLISITTKDKDMCSLASTLNKKLTDINNARHKYYQGDAELKRAVTNVSHDLRTPLTAIKGYIELLKKENKSKKASEYLDIIENRVNSMKVQLEELFRFSIINSLEDDFDITEVNVCSVLEESIANNYSILKQSGIEPNINIPDSIIKMTDKNALSRIFNNIISNAAKYSDGDLVIYADDKEIVFSNTASSLTEIQVGRLFDRFYTVNEARKSTGIGLSIARELVEKMGGRIYSTYENSVLSIHILL